MSVSVGGAMEAGPSPIFVGAVARTLFYPTLLYNVIRNRIEPEFRWWDAINEHVVLGAVPFPGDVERLREEGVQAVVTLNEPFETLVNPAMYKAAGIDHLHIPTTDYVFAPAHEDICRGVQFIREHELKGQRTYVHCKAGRGRSTTLVLCYLVQHGNMTPQEAIEFVRAKRPRILLAPAQWKAVNDYAYFCETGNIKSASSQTGETETVLAGEGDNSSIAADGGSREGTAEAKERDIREGDSAGKELAVVQPQGVMAASPIGNIAVLSGRAYSRALPALTYVWQGASGLATALESAARAVASKVTPQTSNSSSKTNESGKGNLESDINIPSGAFPQLVAPTLPPVPETAEGRVSKHDSG